MSHEKSGGFTFASFGDSRVRPERRLGFAHHQVDTDFIMCFCAHGEGGSSKGSDFSNLFCGHKNPDENMRTT